jgi:WD40 repeat protein
VASVLATLADMAEDPVAGYAQLVLLALAGERLPTESPVHVSVVFGHGQDGSSGKLTLCVQPGGPAGLYPDPERMAFFTANEKFADALTEAWATSPLPVRSQCVVWDIAYEGTPIDHVEGSSLAAAFGVGLIELRRGKRWVRHLNPRSLDPRCAITGALDRNGLLLPVGDYTPKFRAASRNHWRVIVPKSDPEATKNGEIKVPVARAADLSDAVRLSRRTRLVHVVVAGVVLALVVAGFAWNSVVQADTNRANLRTIAARTASEATQVFNGDEVTGLLLAMASDSIAASAGEHTNSFATLAENEANLVKIERTAHGDYDEADLSPDGALVFLQTADGYISLVNGVNGKVVWSHLYPPGMGIAPGQIYPLGMAISGDDSYAAYSSSDSRIQLLGYAKGRGWRQLASVKEPWKPDEQTAGDVNTAWMLSFSPDSRHLIASDAKSVAAYNVSPTGLGHPAHVCPLPKTVLRNAQILGKPLTATGSDQALLTSGRRVYRLDLTTCQISVAMTLPSGFTAVGAGSAAAKGTLQAVGVNHGSIVLFQPAQKPVTVATLNGLTAEGSVVTPDTSGDLIVTAASDQGIFVFDATASSLLFHTHTNGTAFANSGTLVFIRNGSTEIHSTSGGTIGYINSFYDQPIDHLAWAGNGDIVAAATSGIQVYTNATRPTGVPEAIGDLTTLPGSAGATYALEASPDAPLAAAIIGTGHAAITGIGHKVKASPTRVAAWNVSDDRQLPVPAPPAGHRAENLTFSGSALLIGYTHGLIREFRLSEGSWVLHAQITLPEQPISMSAASDGTVYVLTASPGNTRATVRKLVTLPSGRLAQSASATAPGVGYGQVLALPGDEGAVASTGSGTTTKFTAGLRQVQDAQVNVDAVLSMTRIPGSGEFMIVGPNGFAVLRESTLQEVGDNAWGRAGDVAAAAADPTGAYFATFNFLSDQLNLWSLSPQTLKQEACAAIGTNLTRAQWDRYIGSSVPYQQECPA